MIKTSSSFDNIFKITGMLLEKIFFTFQNHFKHCHIICVSCRKHLSVFFRIYFIFIKDWFKIIFIKNAFNHFKNTSKQALYIIRVVFFLFLFSFVEEQR